MDKPPAIDLPLFPLNTVLFPGGLLPLKVFEARYLDLVSRCLREGTPFGVISLKQGGEVRQAAEAVVFERYGTMAEVIDVDSPQTGLLQVRCRGLQRFRVRSSEQQADGLWVANVRPVADDEPTIPAEATLETVKGLANAIATLKSQGARPFLEPYRFDDAGWVANRWCEILPIPREAKQRLMELREPAVRLQLVDEFLRSKGVVK